MEEVWSTNQLSKLLINSFLANFPANIPGIFKVTAVLWRSRYSIEKDGRHFPKQHLPKGNFSIGIFPRVISQVVTS